MKKLLGLAVVVALMTSVLSFVGCSESDGDEPGPAANVQGDWELTVTYETGSTLNADITLTQVGSGLRGTYKTMDDEATVMGTIFENQITLVVDLADMPIYVGTVTGNNDMAGNRAVAQGMAPGTWTAKRP